MQARTYFPLGKAQGEAFCNRAAETAWLLGNIKACRHSLLIAPRRFGKSSLAERAIAMSGLPLTILNFNICSDEQDVEALIRQAASNLIGKALGAIEKLAVSIKRYVNNLTPKISLGPQYAHLELTASHQDIAAAANVEEALWLIEKLLAEKNQPAVMLFDEFQTVGLIAKGSGVEAAIRNVAQEMKFLAIVFSGSNRSLLTSMFEEESRPLYKLCRKLPLNYIDEEHYQQHLDCAAKSAWKMGLNDEVFTRIMRWSKRHPYYVNYLCDVIWTNCINLPTLSDVDSAWNRVIEEEKSDANAEIASLSLGQKKLLKYIARNPANGLLSASTVRTLGMAQSSIASAISGLIEKDVIEKRADDGQYKIISPVIDFLLKENAL